MSRLLKLTDYCKITKNQYEIAKLQIHDLFLERRELLRQQVIIEHDIIGKEHYRLFKGDSIYEILFAKKKKNLTEEEIEAYNEYRCQLAEKSKRAYNALRVEDWRDIKKEIRNKNKQMIEPMKIVRNVEKILEYEATAIATPQLLFNKTCYWRLSIRERITFVETNERAKKIIKRLKEV